MSDLRIPRAQARRRPRRAPPPRPRRRYSRLKIPHRRIGRVRVPYADAALNALMQEGDLFTVRGRRYLVAPVSRDLAEILILAAAGTEDDEDSHDAEAGDDDDVGIDDLPHDEEWQDMEPEEYV